MILQNDLDNLSQEEIRIILNLIPRYYVSHRDFNIWNEIYTRIRLMVSPTHSIEVWIFYRHRGWIHTNTYKFSASFYSTLRNKILNISRDRKINYICIE